MIDAARASLLLVDDDPLLLQALARLLRPLRRPVLEAANAAQAAELLTQHEIGVLICEPRDAALAAFLIEARERHPGVVRMILTGYPDLNGVLAAVNQSHPFKLLTKPWLNDELIATVKLAFAQYAVNRKRDLLIDEYSGIRSNAERSHAFHVLDALLHSLHSNMSAEAIHQLPVGALLLREGAVAIVNAAAQRFLCMLGLAIPSPGSALSGLPATLATALTAPRRQRIQHRVAGQPRLDYFVLELAAGTLIAFAPEPRAERFQL